MSNNKWVVDYETAKNNFNSIESASELLLKFGIKDDEIDNALIMLYANNEKYVIFRENGDLIFGNN